MLGEVIVSAVEGNRQRLDGGAMFGNVPRVLWEQWLGPDDQGRIELACRSLLVEWRGLKILCEAGIGAFFPPKMRERFGVVDAEHRLLENLSALAIEPSAIDWVILSHLHFDHAGGLLTPYDPKDPDGGSLVFTNARYLVGSRAWERARHPHPRDRASFIPRLINCLEASGRLVIVENLGVPPELAGLVTFFESEGHTPGQLHTVIHGQKRDLIFAGDLIPGCAWVHVPITMGYDRFPEKLIDEKQDLYDRTDFDRVTLFFCHDPDYCSSSLQRDLTTGRVSCRNQQATLERQAL